MGTSICRPYLAVIAVIGALCITPPVLRAATLSYADGIIGNLQHYEVGKNESLIEIARKFGLGFNEIADANPGVDPFIPKAGTLITIPTAWILPVVSRRPRIVINIPEYRLYYFLNKGKVVTFPLGIGDQGRDTPVGRYKVIEKIKNPAWHVPESIRAQAGLPNVVPAGPNNPMGSHALRLSRRDVLIHGTNRPWGIGRRSSHGCLRLYPEDIRRLFRMVPLGTRVDIVSRPVKIGASGKKVFVEAHRYKRKGPSVGEVMHLLADRKWLVRTDFAKLIRAMEEKKGVPVDVTLTR